MKRILYIILVIILGWALLYYGIPRKTFIVNDKNKVVTIYFPSFYYFRNECFYIIPYRYEGFLAPHNNYVLAKALPGALNYLNINWQPSTKYQFKIAFESGCIENKLDTSNYFFAEHDSKDYLDQGESYYYPKYSGYFLDDIVSKKLIKN